MLNQTARFHLPKHSGDCRVGEVPLDNQGFVDLCDGRLGAHPEDLHNPQLKIPEAINLISAHVSSYYCGNTTIVVIRVNKILRDFFLAWRLTMLITRKLDNHAETTGRGR